MFTAVNMQSVRRPYHHGDLKNALVDAAADLAAADGPAQVTVRAVAKRVGVTPTAAYRHFGGHEDLVGAVKDRAMGSLMAAMEKALADVEPSPDPRETAKRRIAATGRGYCTFAISEPGLFRTAFSRAPDPSKPLPDTLTERDPYLALVDAVGALVDVGIVAESERQAVELTAWSAVHGLSTLLIDGPLQAFPAEAKQAAIEDMLGFLTSRWECPER